MLLDPHARAPAPAPEPETHSATAWALVAALLGAAMVAAPGTPMGRSIPGFLVAIPALWAWHWAAAPPAHPGRFAPWGWSPAAFGPIALGAVVGAIAAPVFALPPALLLALAVSPESGRAAAWLWLHFFALLVALRAVGLADGWSLRAVAVAVAAAVLVGGMGFLPLAAPSSLQRADDVAAVHAALGPDYDDYAVYVVTGHRRRVHAWAYDDLDLVEIDVTRPPSPG